MLKQFSLIIILLFLLACSSSTNNKYNKNTFGRLSAPNTYTVKRGDTLFSIAWIYGLDPSSIQRRNGLSNPNKIFVGQKLRLRNVARGSIDANRRQASQINQKTSAYRPSKPKVIANWVWPIKGAILRNFNSRQIGANGIRIAGKPQQIVSAAEAGTVAYKGNGLNGYGNVVVIKHKNGLLSAYGFLNKTYVKEGQKVKKRQRIGTVGFAANKQYMLHFEVRRHSKPVNPKAYIGYHYRF